eukprot:4294704-Pyramimonas_sp.AAC.1
MGASEGHAPPASLTHLRLAFGARANSDIDAGPSCRTSLATANSGGGAAGAPGKSIAATSSLCSSS